MLQQSFTALKDNPPMLWAACVGVVLLALLLLAVVHFVPRRGKRTLTVALTFLAGSVYALEFFWPPEDPTKSGNFVTPYVDIIGNVLQVVMGFTFLLGIFNLVYIHTANVRRRRPNWAYSLIFFASFVAMAVAAFWRDSYRWFGPRPEALTLADLPPGFILDRNMLDDSALRDRLALGPIPESFDPRYANDLYTYLFQGFYMNLEATMFSILAFYIASAAYRAFRIRSAEAGLMMATAIILMAGQVPLGMALTNWIPAEHAAGALRIENVSYWVLSVMNMPVQRAIDFGLGLGALAMSLRIWLSLERGSYFGQEV